MYHNIIVNADSSSLANRGSRKKINLDGYADDESGDEAAAGEEQDMFSTAPSRGANKKKVKTLSSHEIEGQEEMDANDEFAEGIVTIV